MKMKNESGGINGIPVTDSPLSRIALWAHEDDTILLLFIGRRMRRISEVERESFNINWDSSKGTASNNTILPSCQGIGAEAQLETLYHVTMVVYQGERKELLRNIKNKN